MPVSDAELALAEWVATTYADPLAFVMGAYPWGEPGTPLEKETGPDEWQREHLTWIGEQVRLHGFDGVEAVDPIRDAISSGHGTGKSTEAGWIADWIMSTRPDARGTVTANTFTQAKTKTWASIAYWTRLCITGHWFVVNDSVMYHKDHKSSWFCALQSSEEKNSEAFAGQHAKNSTSFYLFDESSAIPDKIFEVAEGGLTDGEPMIFLWGNCTRSYGKFYRVCFGSERDRWHVVVVDSRQSRFTNKKQIEEWRVDHGEDSDFFRVRVRGLAPAASDLQYIGSDVVRAAQVREVSVLTDAPLVCGLDVARGGDDDCVFRFRRGHDARSIPPIRIPGREARDSMRLVTVAADVLSRWFDERKVSMLFVDGTGIGGPICDRLIQLGHHNVMEVQFGAMPPADPKKPLTEIGAPRAPEQKFANMRAFMWGKMRDWLRHGAIDPDGRLAQDLTGPGYFHDKQDRLVLESKESMKARGVDSPDDGDALALTFAADIQAHKAPRLRDQQRDDDPADRLRLRRSGLQRGGY